jgi:hypothetical protein
VRSEHVHPKHPPDKEYRNDGPRNVSYPVASCFRFSKIEHAAMVAGPAHPEAARSCELESGTKVRQCWAPQ